jgi:hypothetical protein
MEQSQHVNVSDLSFDVEMSDTNRTKLVKEKSRIKVYKNKASDGQVINRLIDESFQSEIGLNGKPVLNTI